MKFQNVLTTLGFALLAVASTAQHRNCGTMEVLEQQLLNDPQMAERMAHIEAHTEAFSHNNLQERAVITIPVVVHVVYNTAAQNISDAQIMSQINTLNADFGGTNADAANIPTAFQGVKAGDAQIRFCLAQRDPNGNPTTGITRTSTTKTSFSTNDGVKSSTTGGVNAWNTAQYLNLWVCNLGNGILGYAQFPGGAASTDGVVCLYSAFGNTSSAPYNLGRTTTHEVGHWLNLRHIWGDATCGSDLVNDTPTHNTANYGCPTQPHLSTCTGTPREMTMNYMDYTDDACMYMFSAGQSARMAAVLGAGGARASLATSLGCTPPSTATCGTPAGLGSSSITASSATLSWGAVSGASSYSLQYKAASATTWTTVSTTSATYNLAGLSASTTYNYQVSAVCSGASSAYSAAASFTTSASGSTGGAPTNYCASSGGNTTSGYINRFQVGSINNTSGNNNGYGNYTTLQTNLVKGTSNTVTIIPAWAGTKYKNGYKVWIDLNRDGDFLDAGENVYSRASTTNTTVSGTFTLPTTASIGLTRMRVQMKYNSSTITSCETMTYGEVEDYLVNITSAREIENAGAVATQIALYPNPTSAELTIFSADFEGVAKVARIMDIAGKEMKTVLLDANQVVVDVATLPAGMYFVVVPNSDARLQTVKFIKQ